MTNDSVQNITIAITGLNATDNPGPGIPVARGLLESNKFNCRIIGLCYDIQEPGAYMSNLISASYSIPYPAYGKEALLKRILEINEQDKIDIIIPNYDAELESFIKISSILRNHNIYTFLPTEKQFECRDKCNLPKLGNEIGFLTPDTKIYFSTSEFLKNPPIGNCYVKGKFYEAYKALSTEESKSYFFKLASKWGFPVLSQQIVNGSEFNVVGCGDGKGNTIAAVAMKKQFITDKGKAWSGITIKNPKIIDLCNRFVRETKWNGGFELELIIDDESNIYVIEINPRLPAWVYLAIGVGQNIPEQIALLAKGLNAPVYTDYEVGKMFIRYSWDMIVEHDDMVNFGITGTKSNS